MNRSRTAVLFLLSLFVVILPLSAQTKVEYTDQEKAIGQQLHQLRAVPDDQRAAVTKNLALEIRKLPVSIGKLRLATGLSNLSTEGDFGHDTLQEVTTTLTLAIQECESKVPADKLPYADVARLVRYEGTQTSLTSPGYKAAMAEFEATDQLRANADFTLTDLRGTRWSLRDLKGKVVLVNFWATWCPPCRKEIADLEKLYGEFSGKGFVILGVSDDDVAKLRDFATKQNVQYPVLPDLGRKVHSALHIEGIPATLVYDRSGKLVAQAVDMRTRQQFLHLLSLAGLQ